MTSMTRRWTTALVLATILVDIPLAQAGVFKGHPYHERHGAGSSHAVAPQDDSASVPTEPCENCIPGATAATAESTATTAASSSSICGVCNSCPPPTTASLQIWAPEDEPVYVNGYATKPQQLAGIHKGSRVIMLTGLTPGREYTYSVSLDKRVPAEMVHLKAGEKREIHLKAEPPAPPRKHSPRGRKPRTKPAEDHHPKLQALIDDGVAKMNATLAAVTAQVEQAKTSEQQAAAAATAARNSREAATLAQREAEKAKIQAARSNTENFIFEQDHKVIFAWATFTGPMQKATVSYDTSSNDRSYAIKETSGALANLPSVPVRLRLKLTVEHPTTPPPEKPVVLEDLGTVDMEVVFDNGVAKLPLQPQGQSDSLGAILRTTLDAKWSRVYDGHYVKVEVLALRPNGNVAPVAPYGNRLTLLIQKLESK